MPAVADAGRVAVGLQRGADAERVAAAIERRTGSRPELLRPIPALVVDLPRGASLAGIEGIRYVEPLRSRRLAFTPSDPLVSRQWYLTQSRFYEPWLTLPALERVPVAVIDSGVDATHPELAGKILDSRSFVGGSAGVDTLGHGTFVAGLIAAGVGNGIGIAGLAPSSELLVAKVVTPSRAIPIEAEAKAIRWAVESGARVINLSLGGIRDPLDPDRDSFSRLEADAVAYAVSNGAVVVAAVGNGDQAPSSPWPYASYPAALAARPRRQRAQRNRRCSQVLESRQGLQRPGGARRPDPLDLPEAADVALSRVCRAGLLELRAGGVPRGAGHLLRRSAGRPPPPRSSSASGHCSARSR